MKITPTHYDVLKQRVAPLIVHIPALTERFGANPKVRDVNKAVLWELFHRAKMYQRYTYQEWDYIDTHIETAMKKILKELT